MLGATPRELALVGMVIVLVMVATKAGAIGEWLGELVGRTRDGS